MDFRSEPLTTREWQPSRKEDPVPGTHRREWRKDRRAPRPTEITRAALNNESGPKNLVLNNNLNLIEIEN